MAGGNGSGRSERERLLNQPIKLFSVNTAAGFKEIFIPMLPARLAIDWSAQYEAAIDQQNDLVVFAQQYEGRQVFDPEKDPNKFASKEDYRKAYLDRKTAVSEAYAACYWRYGELCAEFSKDKKDPLFPEETRDWITMAQVMEAVARMARNNDPLYCLGDSKADLDIERLQALTPSASRAR